MGRKSLLPIAYNYLGSVTTIASTKSLPASRVTVSYDFVYDDGKPGSGGTGAIFIDGKKVASSRIEHTIGFWRGVRIAVDLPESASQNSFSIPASQNVADP